MISAVVLSSVLTPVAWTGTVLGGQVRTARGVVFEDKNRNGKRDSGEKGIPNIRVSDQLYVVKTNANGEWSMPLRSEDVAFFVVKPRDWMTPVDEDMLPQFSYIHKPAGSPQTRFPGVAPTGPLPASIDFPLHRSREPKKFEALFFGDTQPRNVTEVDYIRRDIIEPIVGKTNARFGVTLGDVVFDDLNVFKPLNQAVALLGLPWYNVLGNHDINMDVEHDHHSDETWEAVYGPNYYSFEHGPVHFIALDNVHWNRPNPSERGGYTARFGVQQLTWLKNELAHIPEDRLIVFCMHIPLIGTEDRAQLYRLIENRPYTLSVAAHTHYQEHHFLGKEQGWNGKEKHHHVVNVTTSGSWWSGLPDELGIPHTTMRDGAPNGYSIFSFDGNQYSIQFRAARRPESYQMEIQVPDQLMAMQLVNTSCLVNVFGGNERSKVEIRYGKNGAWLPMTKTLEPDPSYVQMKKADETTLAPFRKLPGIINSPHLWKAPLPTDAKPGFLMIEVRTTDMFGQVFMATKGIRIL